MTKEQFCAKWEFSSYWKADLEAVIATEIEKSKVQPQPSDKVQISKHTLVEVNRAFRALKRDTESYVHKVFGDDGVFDAMKEISEAYKYYFGEYPTEQIPSTPTEQPQELKGNCSTFDGSRLVDQEYKPAEQPASEMCESDAIDYILTNKLNWKKLGDNRMFAIGFARTGASFRVSFVEYNHTLSGTREVIINNIDLSEWQPVDRSIKPNEQPAQPSSQAKLDNSFDKDRFEAMFRAVVASGEFIGLSDQIGQTMINLKKLDAYYAEKGGNNE